MLSGITVLNNILVIISRIRLSVAQPSSSFKLLNTYTFKVRHTHPCNLSALSRYSSTGVFNDCYSVLMLYTALANSYGVCVYDAYQFQGHAH